MSATKGLRCWGQNANGEAGVGNTGMLLSPPTTDAAMNVTSVAIGFGFTCVVLGATSGVRCMGTSNYGVLGNGLSTGALYTLPTSDIIVGVQSVYAGYLHACVIVTATAGVRCWGENGFNQLGISNAYVVASSPPTTDLLTGVAQLALGQYHTCAVMRGNGGVRCWGRNDYGQCGNGGTAPVTAPPTSDTLVGVSAISSTGNHVCVIMRAGSSVRCWGSNHYGQCGDITNSVLTTAGVGLLTGVAQVATGWFHTCVLMAVGSGVRCWGENSKGALGTGSTVNTAVASALDTFTGYSQLAVGMEFTCGIFAGTGGARCWGDNQYATAIALVIIVMLIRPLIVSFSILQVWLVGRGFSCGVHNFT